MTGGLALRAASVLVLSSTTAIAQNVEVERYVLDNGLTVILHEDRRLPISTINLWYRVGAKEEPRGRSGFAHLFEHLMFMGTERVPGHDFDRLMEAGGGSNNASTALDRTNYFSSGPSELLPTLLWLDADRLEDLGRMMDQEKLDKQRDVVRNELRQVVENEPYGKADFRIYQMMYPEGHPYHNSVIGTHEDLEAASVTNVKDFFATFYVPNNCSLVVAGDFDPATIKPLVNDLFGTLPRGGGVVHREAKDWPIPQLDRVLRTTMLDKVELPRLSFVYHAPAWYAPGDAETRLLGDVLASGKSSRLYRRLVMDEQIAVEVGAVPDQGVLGSLFMIHVMARPDADLGRIEAVVDEELGRLLNGGVSGEELTQRKNQFELQFLASMTSLSAVADRLNEYEFAWGEPNSFKRDLDRYRNATPESVGQWARKVLTPEARLIMRVLPEEPARAEGPRDTRPSASSQTEFTLPQPEAFTLDCGVKVLLWNRSELPLVSAVLTITPGGALDTAQNSGLAELTSTMLTEGAGNLDAVAFADAVEQLGAHLDASASTESISVSLTSVRRTFEQAAGLMGMAVREPRLAADDFERVRRLHISQLEQDLTEAAVISQRVAARVLFGDDHPYSRPSAGTVESVRAITLADVRAAHESLFTPDRATLLVCGDVSASDARRAFNEAFSGWKRRAPASRAGAISPRPSQSANAMRVFIVDRPQAVQTVIRFAAPGPRRADANRPGLLTLNTIFGGSFTSRLNQNLREDHGYTYGARSSFVMGPSAGWFTAGSAVQAEVTGAALQEFLKEFARLKTGDISGEEVLKAVRTRRTDTIEAYSSLLSIPREASFWVEAGLPLDSPTSDLAAQSRLSASDLNALAGRAVDLDGSVLVLVGDRQTLLTQLKGLGLPEAVLLEPFGEPMSESPEPRRGG